MATWLTPCLFSFIIIIIISLSYMVSPAWFLMRKGRGNQLRVPPTSLNKKLLLEQGSRSKFALLA